MRQSGFGPLAVQDSLQPTATIRQRAPASQRSAIDTPTSTGTIALLGGQITFGLAVICWITGPFVSTTATTMESDEARPPGSVTVSVKLLSPGSGVTLRVLALPTTWPAAFRHSNWSASPSGSEDAEPSSVTVVSGSHSTRWSGPASAWGCRLRRSNGAKREKELTLAQMIFLTVSCETVWSTQLSGVPSPLVSS